MHNWIKGRLYIHLPKRKPVKHNFYLRYKTRLSAWEWSWPVKRHVICFACLPSLSLRTHHVQFSYNFDYPDRPRRRYLTQNWPIRIPHASPDQRDWFRCGYVTKPDDLEASPGHLWKLWRWTFSLELHVNGLFLYVERKCAWEWNQCRENQI